MRWIVICTLQRTHTVNNTLPSARLSHFRKLFLRASLFLNKLVWVACGALFCFWNLTYSVAVYGVVRVDFLVGFGDDYGWDVLKFFVGELVVGVLDGIWSDCILIFKFWILECVRCVLVCVLRGKGCIDVDRGFWMNLLVLIGEVWCCIGYCRICLCVWLVEISGGLSSEILEG